MGKHELALQHAMKALILIQDELISKVPAGGDMSQVDQTMQQDPSQASMTGLP